MPRTSSTLSFKRSNGWVYNKGYPRVELGSVPWQGTVIAIILIPHFAGNSRPLLGLASLLHVPTGARTPITGLEDQCLIQLDDRYKYPRKDSNLRHPASKAGVPSAELQGHYLVGAGEAVDTVGIDFTGEFGVATALPVFTYTLQSRIATLCALSCCVILIVAARRSAYGGNPNL